MIQSMTGFAEKRFSSKNLTVAITIRSLNHRFLDWNYRGDQIGEVENSLRAIAQKKLHRGRIEVFLELSYLDSSNWSLTINEELLRRILLSTEKISSRMKKSLSFSVKDMFGLPHVVEMRRKAFSQEQTAFLEKCFEKTLDEVLKLRQREGREIAREIQIYLKNIRQMVNRIDKLHKKQPVLIKEKMARRLKELDHEGALTEEKLAGEAAFFAQRYDLTEEIVRLKSHLDFAGELFSPKNKGPFGKKLDFIAQELYREANTINSKSQEIAIVKESLAIKGEVENIRQQVQNIE